MTLKVKSAKIALPLIILLSGAVIMYALIKSSSEPKKEIKKETGALVRVLKVEKTVEQVIVKGTGTVKAQQEITVMPQVSGQVTYVSPLFVAGGFFKKDDLLFEIEDTDYRLAIQQAEAANAKAEQDLATIESQARVARMEWERLDMEKKDSPNPLVLYEPQLKNAKAALASADASVEQAKLNLKRTKVTAPFNCRVSSENIDPGQYVRAGNSVAVLSSTDVAEIVVPLPLDEQRWIKIPIHINDGKGSFATVSLNIGGKEYQWHGHVVRSLGEVDTKTRMMKVVVSIDDPYGLSEINKGRPALATGSFVYVNIMGKRLTNVFSVPRTAFREDSTVWIMDKTKKLRIRKVAPLRIEHEKVLIGEGLKEGDMVVLTTLSGAADGMKLKTIKGK